jgi:ectoine hydroxylase-related dioxygenase (phytanoyl-CoA dioxygenase family)
MLTQDQTTSFRENGYLHVPAIVSDEEIRGLRQATDDLLVSLPDLPEVAREDFKYGALVGDRIGEGDQLCRVEYTFHKDERFLLLLGNPRLLEIAGSLADGPLVVTWEDMIVKTPGTSLAVPFHQDALHQCERTPVFSIGIYLDDSDDDPLLVIPGSHELGRLSEAEIRSVVRAREADVIRVPVKAGDALVHNVRVIHGSGFNAGAAARRVIYIEFRTPAQIREDSPWSEAWLERRAGYIAAAIGRRARHALGAGDPVTVDELLAGRSAPIAATGAISPDAELDLRVHHQDGIEPVPSVLSGGRTGRALRDA